MNYEGLYDINYRFINHKPTILLFIRQNNNERIVKKITNFKQYCYIKSSIFSTKIQHPNIVEIINTTIKGLYNEEVVKVVVDNPFNISKIKEYYEQINCFEADIPFDMRFGIDEVQTISSTKYKIGYFDIETTCKQGFPNYKNPVEHITCLSLYDNYSENNITFVWRQDLEYKFENNTYYFNNEVDMLNALLNYWNKSKLDILTGWNISFDMNYLVERLKYLKLNYFMLSSVPQEAVDKYDTVKIKTQMYKIEQQLQSNQDIEILGVVIFDLLSAYKRLHFGELPSFSLNSIAELELGDKKDNVLNFDEVWLNDIELLIKYNKKDVMLTVNINNKCKLISIFDDMRRYAGVRNINDCHYMSRNHDTRILKKYHNKIVFPCKSQFVVKTLDDKIQGAFVKCEQGLYDNVIVLDFSGLYPNIIKTFNLSPEMINDNGVNINNTLILQEPIGIMPSIIDDLLELKTQMKQSISDSGSQNIRDKMFAVKIFINSIWGVYALRSFRLYDSRLANNVTFLGRELIQKAIELVTKEFNYIIPFSDTDSMGIVIPKEKDHIKEGFNILTFVNKQINIFITQKYKIKNSSIKMEFEKSFKTLLLHKKKNYAGLIDWDDGVYKTKISTAGLATRRSDTQLIAKELQNNLLNIVLNKGTSIECINYVTQVIDLIYNKQISLEQLSIPTKLEKSPELYGNLPVVRGCKFSEKHLKLKFKAGMKFKLIYIVNPYSDVVCFNDNDDISNLVIDYKKIIERVIKKIEPIFFTMKWFDEYNNILNYINNKINKQQTLSVYN